MTLLQETLNVIDQVHAAELERKDTELAAIKSGLEDVFNALWCYVSTLKNQGRIDRQQLLKAELIMAKISGLMA